MQFKNIVAFVSLAVMASALPTENLVERTEPTPGQTLQNQCSQGQTVKCCNSVTQGLVNVLPIGLNCVDIDRKKSIDSISQESWLLSLYQSSPSCRLALNAPRPRNWHAAILALRYVSEVFRCRISGFNLSIDWSRQRRPRLPHHLVDDVVAFVHHSPPTMILQVLSSMQARWNGKFFPDDWLECTAGPFPLCLRFPCVREL